MESVSSQCTGGERKGHWPTRDWTIGFDLVETDDMANELIGVVMHVDDLLDEAHEELRKIKAQFRAAVWGGRKGGRKSWKFLE